MNSMKNKKKILVSTIGIKKTDIQTDIQIFKVISSRPSWEYCI